MAYDLHVYLKTKPAASDIKSMLALLGFRKSGESTSATPAEPAHTEWVWKHKNLSEAGFSLLLFDGMYPDCVRAGDFRTFIVMEGGLDSSGIDVSMVDITAALLLKRYGGTVHNPNRLDRKVPNVYLCGKSSTKT